ncbi:hypothetical protein J8273_4323 [Carpediemonas membranifera]|uniref:Cystatin domain-containing protein n=1 Tax=Carpediemonas membranifera TaxID=201153 RepID=A0A8J6BY79_9EUKA|nr:hypothetical protein J8273_4323 [Carpediemonas membranifera]|eukprot:KAG9394221.1 hypothetical protein J8273_4323 [Carpediemonas membranifera]
MMAGGITAQTFAPEEHILKFALERINMKSNSIKNLKLGARGVMKYGTQVVAGTNHHLSLDIIDEDESMTPSVHHCVVYEGLPPACKLEFKEDAHKIEQ